MSKTLSSYFIGIAIVTAVLVGAFTHISGLDSKLHLTDFIAHASGLSDGGESGSGCCGGGSTGGTVGGHDSHGGGTPAPMCNGAAIPNGCSCEVTQSHGCSASKGECIITETLKCPIPPKDFCPNISGTQDSVPSGYVTDSAGNCVIDQCPNISGIQTSIPSGYVLNNGQCVIDKCPNLSGVQTSIPNGYVVNAAGQCVIDQCPNIDGIQESIPSGYTKDASGMCQPPKDYCPNIAGIQTSVPAGKIVDASGNCVDIPQCVAPKLTSATSAEGQVGVAFSYTLTVSGTQPITVKFDNLPAGLTASGNTISGTPTKAGNYEVGVTLDNKCGNVCTKIIITVKAGECKPGKPVLPTQQTTSGTVGQSFSYEVQVTNDPTEVTATNLPAGLSINPNTGVISGTPTAAGTFTVHIKAKNDCGTAEIDIVIKITTNVCIPGAPSITSALAANGVVGTPFSYTITTDKTATEYTVVDLPAGLTFATSTGVISGTPSATGTFEVKLTVKNICGQDYKKLIITITAGSCPVPAPHITSGTSASATLNQAFSYTLTTSGNPSSITTGTLPSWLSYNSQTGIISGTPTAAGTYTVDFNISNQCGTDHITLTIVVTGGGGSCTLQAPTITSGTDISVTRGQSVSYSITTSGTVTSIAVENLPTWLNYSTSSQVIFGTAPSSGDYAVTIKALNECAIAQITLTIHVIGEPGCTSNCGGGGFFAPTVVLLQQATTTNPLASYASVYLSQVPYTGAGDIATTLAFLLGLLALSLGAAYVIVYRKELSYRLFGGNRAQSSFSVVAAPAGVFEAPLMPVAMPAYPASEESSSGDTLYESMPKKKEETNDNEQGQIKTFYSSDFGASISEGLAAIKQNLERKEGAVEASASNGIIETNKDAMGATLEEAARASGAMLSKDGVELILTASDNKIENALRILTQMISVAGEWYPAGEGAYLMLDANRVRSILFSTYISMVPLFIRWIAENDHAKVFNFLRMINHQGHAVSDFVKAVAYELDKVYRFRTEHDAGADEYSVQVTSNWKKETIEKVVTTLVGGFDDNYSSSLTAAKLAFSKVLDTVRNQNIPGAEQYRLAEGN